MHLNGRYALFRYFRDVTAEIITGWIERPHLLQPSLVGVSRYPDVVDRQTNGDAAWLYLAVWRCSGLRIHQWPIDPAIADVPLWLLTTWTDDPGLQHLLSCLASTESLDLLLEVWPDAATAIPLDSEWLEPDELSLLTIRAASL